MHVHAGTVQLMRIRRTTWTSDDIVLCENEPLDDSTQCHERHTTNIRAHTEVTNLSQR